jgi:hypothetical protein
MRAPNTPFAVLLRHGEERLRRSHPASFDDAASIASPALKKKQADGSTGAHKGRRYAMSIS